MFTTPCFIRKNTPELRKKLEKLGYCPNPFEQKLYEQCPNYVGSSLHTRRGYYTMRLLRNKFNGLEIYCRLNEDRFLAISALRDDSDENQWFTDGKTWFKCEYEDIEQKREEAKACNYFGAWVFNCHKATVEELIKHFNHG